MSIEICRYILEFRKKKWCVIRAIYSVNFFAFYLIGIRMCPCYLPSRSHNELIIKSIFKRQTNLMLSRLSHIYIKHNACCIDSICGIFLSSLYTHTTELLGIWIICSLNGGTCALPWPRRLCMYICMWMGRHELSLYYGNEHATRKFMLSVFWYMGNKFKHWKYFSIFSGY